MRRWKSEPLSAFGCECLYECRAHLAVALPAPFPLGNLQASAAVVHDCAVGHYQLPGLPRHPSSLLTLCVCRRLAALLVALDATPDDSRLLMEIQEVSKKLATQSKIAAMRDPTAASADAQIDEPSGAAAPMISAGAGAGAPGAASLQGTHPEQRGADAAATSSQSHGEADTGGTVDVAALRALITSLPGLSEQQEAEIDQMLSLVPATSGADDPTFRSNQRAAAPPLADAESRLSAESRMETGRSEGPATSSDTRWGADGASQQPDPDSRAAPALAAGSSELGLPPAGSAPVPPSSQHLAEELAAVQAQHRAAEELVAELTSAAEAHSEAIARTEAAAEQESARRREQHGAEVAEMRDAHVSELEAVRADSSGTGAEMEAKLRAEMEELRSSHEAALAAAAQESAAQLREVQAHSEEAYSDLSAKHADAVEAASTAAEASRQQIDAELAAAAVEKRAAVAALVAERHAVMDDHESAIAAAETSHRQAMDETVEKLATQQASHDQALDSAQANANRRFMRAVTQRWRYRGLSKCVASWKELVIRNRAMRHRRRKVILRMRNVKCAAALGTWSAWSWRRVCLRMITTRAIIRLRHRTLSAAWSAWWDLRCKRQRARQMATKMQHRLACCAFESWLAALMEARAEALQAEQAAERAAFQHELRTAAETAAAAEQRHTMERDTLAAQTAALGQELADARQEIEALRQQSAEYLAEKVRAQESVRP